MICLLNIQPDDIAEILLKLALNTNQSINQNVMSSGKYFMHIQDDNNFNK